MKGNPAVIREEVAALMIERADDIMNKSDSQIVFEQGVICFCPDNQGKHAGIVRWQTPEESSALLDGEGPRLIVVYGHPGSGVMNCPGFIGIKNLRVMHVSSKGELVYQRCI